MYNFHLNLCNRKNIFFYRWDLSVCYNITSRTYIFSSIFVCWVAACRYGQYSKVEIHIYICLKWPVQFQLQTGEHVCEAGPMVLGGYVKTVRQFVQEWVGIKLRSENYSREYC